MTDKIALVTGAGTGIGRACSLALMKAGFTVVLAGRRADKLAEVATEGKAAGGKSLVVTADMTSVEVRRRRCSRPVKDTYGRLDLLFNNAGMSVKRNSDRGRRHRRMEARRRHQPHRVPALHARSLPHHEGPEAAGRTHHQQRLDVGAGAASAALSATPRPSTRITGLTKATALDGRAYDIACGQIDIGNAQTRVVDASDRRHAASGGAQRRTAHGRAERRRCGGLYGEPAARRERAVHDGDGDQDAAGRPRLTTHNGIFILPGEPRPVGCSPGLASTKSLSPCAFPSNSAKVSDTA